MELNPKFEKAWKYANNFMYGRIKNEGHLTVFLKDPDVRKQWSDEERAFLKDAWFVITTGSCSPENKDVAGEPILEEELSVDESRIYEDIDASILEAEFETEEEVDFEAMTKRQIDEWAEETHGIKLDRRQSKTNMLKELEEKLN